MDEVFNEILTSLLKCCRCGQLQELATACLQKLGQSVPAACFCLLILSYKGYCFHSALGTPRVRLDEVHE